MSTNESVRSGGRIGRIGSIRKIGEIGTISTIGKISTIGTLAGPIAMSSPGAPSFAIDDIELFERPVRFRMPFRFGAVTVDHAPQAFVRVLVRFGDGSTAVGVSAEMMIPKWFDKDPALDNEANIDQLRRSLSIARDGYLADRSPATAFGHHVRHHSSLLADGAQPAEVPLVAGYGPALIDRAVIDAVARGRRVSFFELMRSNLVDFRASSIAPDVSGVFDDRWLAHLAPRMSVEARHTVGLTDLLDGDTPHADEDGLPRTLAEVIARYGHRWFKIKLSGDIDADRHRLAEIASVLETAAPAYRVTLDGNEQFRDAAHVRDAWDAFVADRRLQTLLGRVEWIEQPIARARALSEPIARLIRPTARGSTALPDAVPLMIDESDGDIDAFVRALALGYRGVSSKSCKGLYKSIVNRIRVGRWNASHSGDRAFISGEDLTMQAGIAVQQDLALVSLLGIEHVERNGHHYVAGMQGAPEQEQHAFALAHPDLYTLEDDRARLVIKHGGIQLRSLGCEGFASAVLPDCDAMTPMRFDGHAAAAPHSTHAQAVAALNH